MIFIACNAATFTDFLGSEKLDFKNETLNCLLFNCANEADCIGNIHETNTHQRIARKGVISVFLINRKSLQVLYLMYIDYFFNIIQFYFFKES